MATILEEVLRLGVDPNLAIAAMSMPSRANITGATRYTIPGEGTSEFIRPKTAEEIAVAARALGEAATPNRFAGRMIGDSPGQAQGYALQAAQQRQQAAQFAAQMVAQERRAQEQAQLRRELVNTEWQSRQGIADRNREAQIMEAVARLSRTPGGAGASSARTVRSSANSVGPGPTVADLLYGEQARLFGQQPGIEASNEALGSLLEGRTAQATALFGSSGAQRALDQSILSADEAEAIGVDPYTTIAEAVRTVGARGPGNEAALKMLESRIAAERASGRLGQALPQPAPVTLSPLAQILQTMQGTAGADGRVTYSPAQTAEALTRLGWRGAYGDPAAQARAAAMSRYRAMGLQPTVEPEPAPTPARQGFGDLRVSEATPGVRRLVATPVAEDDGRATLLGMFANLLTGSANPNTVTEVQLRRQAGEMGPSGAITSRVAEQAGTSYSGESSVPAILSALLGTSVPELVPAAYSPMPVPQDPASATNVIANLIRAAMSGAYPTSTVPAYR